MGTKGKRKILLIGGPLDGMAIMDDLLGAQIHIVYIACGNGGVRTAHYEWGEIPERGACRANYIGTTEGV